MHQTHSFSMSSGLAKFHVGLRPHFRRIHVTTPARGIFLPLPPQHHRCLLPSRIVRMRHGQCFGEQNPLKKVGGAHRSS